MVTRRTSPGEKLPRNESDFSPLTRVNVTNNLHTYIYREWWLGGWGLGQGSTNFPKIYKPPPNCGSRKGDMQYMPYSGSEVLDRPFSFTAIWRLLLRVRGMMYFLYERKIRTATIIPKILRATVQNLIRRKTTCLGFVHFLTGAKNKNKNASALCVCVCFLKLY